MTLIQKIKDAQLQARKDRNGLRATLLTTIIGEAETLGKRNGNNAPTDAEVIQTLKKFEKNIRDNIAVYGDRRMADESDAAWAELEVVQEFLPKKLEDDEVKAMINWILGAKELPREQKSMGIVVKMLKEKYGDQFDGQQVSRLFKEVL